MSPQTPTLYVVCGPTAAGKTEASLVLAEHLGCPILSADSRQFYKEMRIGNARPGRDELGRAPHYFIADRSVTEERTAGTFEDEAMALLKRIFRDRSSAILVGGSGFFIQAVCAGLDPVPPEDPDIREGLNRELEEKGLEDLVERLREKDPTAAERMDLNNPRRVVRAIEVCLSTGHPFSSFQQRNTGKTRPFAVRKFGICPDRETLYRRIHERTDRMVLEGLVQEAMNLYPLRHYRPLKTVGYRELFAAFNGTYSIEHSIELIKRNTRRLAKRQLTWFRRDPGIKWFEPGAWEALKAACSEQA